jgi:hypothetical protein
MLSKTEWLVPPSDLESRYERLSKKKETRAFQNEAIEIYKAFYEHFYGERPNMDYPRAFNSLNQVVAAGYTTKQVICMIFLHFEWRGFEGNNDNCLRALFDRHFPIEWIKARSDIYATYIINTIGEKRWKDQAYLDELLAKWELVLFGSKVS